MKLADGYTDVPQAKVVAVVTSLQMFERPPVRDGSAEATWVLSKVESFDPDAYRALFRRVGEDWLWFSRLQLSDNELKSLLADPARQHYVFTERGRDAGVLELDFGTQGECELAFFGLMPHMIGRGAGRWMMNRALDIAWSRPIRRAMGAHLHLRPPRRAGLLRQNRVRAVPQADRGGRRPQDNRRAAQVRSASRAIAR